MISGCLYIRKRKSPFRLVPFIGENQRYCAAHNGAFWICQTQEELVEVTCGEGDAAMGAPSVDLRGFEVLYVGGNTFLLRHRVHRPYRCRAVSEEECLNWIEALRAEILRTHPVDAAIHRSPPTSILLAKTTSSGSDGRICNSPKEFSLERSQSQPVERSRWTDTSPLHPLPSPHPSYRAFCSWCFALASHQSDGGPFPGALGLYWYSCSNCKKPTRPCNYCGRAFARGVSSTCVRTRACAHCLGEIDDWAVVEDNIHNAENCEHLAESMALNSSFPTRSNVDVEFLVDGKDTFEAMFDAMDNAKESIYISFWMMCASIPMKRNGTHDVEEFRCDNLLQRKAAEGVMVCVLLWEETTGMKNMSRRNKEVLEELHPNIRVYQQTHLLQKFLVVDQEVAVVGGIDIAAGRYDTGDHLMTDPTGNTWWGVDYYCPHVEVEVSPTVVSDPHVMVVDPKEHPRMPWHDVDVRLTGLAAWDVARNFIDRWNHHIPVSGEYGSLTLKDKSSIDCPKGSARCQLLRSIGEWSGAPDMKTEKSILGAYISAIDEASHFVYIENQFFTSCTAGEGVQNQVAAAVVRRVSKAIRNQECFRVIILFPQPEEVGRWALAILKWEYKTIHRLLDQLAETFPDVDLEQYIVFCQLRVHGVHKGTAVSDQIFIHSKLLIADDEIAIVGSNNINDRSLLGDRDSELAVKVTDVDRWETTMNHQLCNVGKAVHNLRAKLWCEHLGLAEGDARVEDPICSETFNDLWLRTAKNNTAIYEAVFPDIPSDKITTWDEFVEIKQCHPTRTKQLINVRGHLCMHPLRFLIDEEMPMRESVAGTETFQ